MLAVTGITGHTGGFFLEELVKNRYPGKIRCLVRTAGKAERLLASGLDVQTLEGSLDDENTIRALLTGADTVVHIANIHFSPAIVRIGMECGVKRFVLVHTTGIYSRFKAASREYIEIEEQILPLMARENITVLRPTMIFGDLNDYNISKFIRFVDALPVLPVVGSGEALVQPVNARDLGKALYRVLENGATFGKAYDLSGEKALSIRALYLDIARELGKKRLILGLPMGLCVFAAGVIRCLSFGRVDLVERVQRMGEDRSYSHRAAELDFGYDPEPFETGLRREVRAYLARKKEG